jgi:hypothetical protein
MRIVVTLLVTVVLALGLWFVLSNAHIELFPCERSEYDFATEQLKPPTNTVCSLLGVFDPDGAARGEQKLTLPGYAVYALVVGLLPLAVGLLVGRRVGAKQPSA